MKQSSSSIWERIGKNDFGGKNQGCNLISSQIGADDDRCLHRLMKVSKSISR
jgi:hypothetical protein